MAGPLLGLRVLDLGTRTSTAWCSRQLADAGAEVHFLHSAAAAGPLYTEASAGTREYVLANKHPLQAPLEAVVHHLDEYDVVIDDLLPAHPLHETLATLARRHGLVHCSITAHGQSGSLAAVAGNDLTAYAQSGWAAINGTKGRLPLKGVADNASHQAGTLAAAAIVAALVARRVEGASAIAADDDHERIDVSERDVLVFTAAPAVLRAAMTGVLPERRGEVDFGSGPVPCKDGWFALPASRDRFWIEAMRFLGLPDLADDTELQQPWTRTRHRERYVARVHAALLQFTKQALFSGLGARRVIAGPVLTFDELATNEHLQARHWFRPHHGVVFPGAPFRLHAERNKTAEHDKDSAQPGLSVANETPAVLSAHAATVPRPRWRALHRPAAPPARPAKGALAGYRGVVLTQAWAGTLATELLALFGADVVQVEPFTRMDSWRGDFRVPMAAGLQDTPTALHPWNCNPLFNSVNLGKRSVTLDLSTPDGIAVFRQLVAGADFVAENFAPRVLNQLGIGFDALRELRPDIVLLSLSGYGNAGPWSAVPAIGGTIEPSSGMSALLGYPGEAPQNSGQMYPDALAGLNGFLALVLALAERARTGRGQHIDLSMQEACLSFLGGPWLDWQRLDWQRLDWQRLDSQRRGEQPEPMGNRHPHLCPHGIFATRGAGAEVRGGSDFIALACPDEPSFRALAVLAGRPDWCTRWKDAPARKADESAVESELAVWLGQQDGQGLCDRLRACGCMAAPVRQLLELLDDADLRARGCIAEVVHPETGTQAQVALPCVMARHPAHVAHPAPLHGEHTLAVLTERLGYTPARVLEMERAGVLSIGTPSAHRRTQTSR